MKSNHVISGGVYLGNDTSHDRQGDFFARNRALSAMQSFCWKRPLAFFDKLRAPSIIGRRSFRGSGYQDFLLRSASTAPAAPAAEQASFPDGTYLDANTVVSKSHPRIFLRGKLDTLISSTVLVQTGFDGNNKLPAVLRNGLSDINVWLWQILQAEVSGEAVPAQSLCGMNAEAIRLVSHDPMKYLGQGHIVPDVALGPNVALLNWLRAQAREVEVAYVQVGMEREDILASLNRLSSAIYVLMLLTVVAESGRDISKVGL